MKLYKIEKDDRKLEDWTMNEDKNPYICETAGFKPLEVQIQEFEQAGVRARFRSEMFDSQDYRDMYMQPDTRITGDDDIETVYEKLRIQRQIQNDIMKRHQKAMAAVKAKQSEAEDKAEASPAVGAE